MFPKLLAIVLVAGMTGAALLVARHQRLEAAHEITIIYEEMIEHERALWTLRGEIARRTHPDALNELLERLGESFEPIPDPDRAVIDVAPAPALTTPDAGLVAHEVINDAEAPG